MSSSAAIGDAPQLGGFVSGHGFIGRISGVFVPSRMTALEAAIDQDKGFKRNGFFCRADAQRALSFAASDQHDGNILEA